MTGGKGIHSVCTELSYNKYSHELIIPEPMVVRSGACSFRSRFNEALRPWLPFRFLGAPQWTILCFKLKQIIIFNENMFNTYYVLNTNNRST